MKTRLVQIAWALLTLASLWVFGYVLVWVIADLSNPPPKQLQAELLAGISPPAFLALNVFFMLAVYLAFFVVAQLIMVRRSYERFSLLAAVVLLTFGTGNAASPVPELFEFFLHMPPIVGIPFYALNFLGWTLLPLFLVTYPDGKFIPRWTILTAILGFIISAFWTTNPELFSTVTGLWAVLLILLLIFGYSWMVYAQVWRYRHYYSPLQKQQVKWFVLGIIGILLTAIPTVLFLPQMQDPQISPSALMQAELIYIFFGFGLMILPITIGIAILRYRLWDIDILIRKTLTYAIVVGLLAIVYFGSVVLLQQLFAQFILPRSEWITVLSTLAIAALFVPLRNRIQALVDRRFYRKKYDAQQVLSDFATTVRDETDLEQLTARLMQLVNETMQPKSVSIWLNRDEGEQPGA